MATLQYSFIPLIMTFLVHSCLLLAILSCFPDKIQGLESINGDGYFHTVQVSSLLPSEAASAPACRPSRVPSERQSTLEVSHNYGSCSKYSTTAKSLTTFLSSDQSRVKSIQARLNPQNRTPGKNNKFKDRKVDLPAQFGEGSLNYVVTVGLGTPQNNLSLIFDTGSDLTWTQCQPCNIWCYNQNETIFNPTLSSSHSSISYDSSKCSQLQDSSSTEVGCVAGACAYNVEYGDHSYSVGSLNQDKLTLTRDDVFPNFMFGCGQHNRGLFGWTAGLLGLGRDSTSFVSQTADKYMKYFSYCLPSNSSSTGHLTFGKNAANSHEQLKFTPFASSGNQLFYYIDIESISVSGKPLKIERTVFTTGGGTIIDSGTVITRLPSAAYRQMRDAFNREMVDYPNVGTYSIFDTCYDIGNYSSINTPKISFTFSGNVTVKLDPSGIFVAVDPTTACLAFTENDDPQDVAIFGNMAQKTLEVVYDVAGEKLGFIDGGCA